MKKVLLCCGMIKKELENVLNADHPDIDVVWLDEDLHSHPDKLREEIQKNIDSLIGYDEIMLSYGLCGNALIGITARHCDILYPKTDDCINALLCDNCRLAELRKNSFFVSRGWLNTDRSGESYERMVKKYGEARAQRIYKAMYKNYNNVVYMKIEDVIADEMNDAALDIADRLDLNLLYEPAGIRLYEKLLTGTDDDKEIKRLKKGETIDYNDFRNK